jgi:hypothetical protein
VRAREAGRFGVDALTPDGWRNQACEKFIEWAPHYGDREGRSLAKHEARLATLPCPVLRLDGSRPLPELISEIQTSLSR